MKYLMLCLLVTFTVVAYGQNRFNVGDTLQCGIVFYIESIDTLSSRQRILICSMKDQSDSIAWNNDQFITTSATADMLFSRANAEQVINVQGSGNYAATLCRDFSLSDSTCPTPDTLWYLPSVAELKLMRSVLDSTGILKFAKEGYWSSVEFREHSEGSNLPEKKAMIVDFLNGRDLPNIKSNKYHVRAIREFITD